jgi:hypothetical protein
MLAKRPQTISGICFASDGNPSSLSTLLASDILQRFSSMSLLSFNSKDLSVEG